MKIKDKIRKDLRKLITYSSARNEFNGKANVFLDANESPFNSEVNRYPDPFQVKLKMQLASIKGVQLNQLFLGNGSDECIDLLIRLLCMPFQDTIAVLSPTYGMYRVSAQINGVKVQAIPLNTDFELPLEKLKQLSGDIKIIFICSPNNPTGNVFSIVDLKIVLKSFDGIVVIDEAYIDFSDENSSLEILNQYENLVVLQTFSKGFGMAGARLGMLFANSELIEYLNKIKPPYNISVLTQQYVTDALTKINEIHKQIQIIKAERNRLFEVIKKHSFVLKVYPSSANFLLVKVENADDLYNKLRSIGIIVRNRSKEPLCENCLRITIGTKDENVLLLNALSNYSTKLKKNEKNIIYR